jgi:hypothetical protein
MESYEEKLARTAAKYRAAVLKVNAERHSAKVIEAPKPKKPPPKAPPRTLPRAIK